MLNSLFSMFGGGLGGAGKAPVTAPVSKDGMTLPEGGFTGFSYNPGPDTAALPKGGFSGYNPNATGPDNAILPEGGFTGFNPEAGGQTPGATGEAAKPDWNKGWRGGLKGVATGSGEGKDEDSPGPTASALAAQSDLMRGTQVSKFGFTPVQR